MHGPKKHGIERWDDLRVFLAVLRGGSFSAAARGLEVEQSTVSRRMAALEESVGAQLFDRALGGLRATDLALRLRERAEAIERDMLDFADLARSDDRQIAGTVTIATTESFAVHVLIPHVVAALEARHPKLRLHLLTSDRSADLSRREADLALRFYRPSSGDLIGKRVATLPLSVLAHRKLARRARSLQTLRWITVQLPGIAQPDEQLLLEQFGVTPALTVSSHLAQVEAVRAGLGVALLSRSLCKLDKQLVELDVGLPRVPPVELWLVALRALRKVPRVAAVWELLESGLTILSER